MDDYIKDMWQNPPSCIQAFSKINDKKLVETILTEYGNYTTAFSLKHKCDGPLFQIYGKSNNNEMPLLIGKIQIQCNKCKQNDVIFNSAIHGYDGILGQGEDYSNEEDILYKCSYCTNQLFHLAVGFQYSGDEEEMIIEENLIMKPQDLFGWFIIHGRCTTCKKINKIASIECQ